MIEITHQQARRMLRQAEDGGRLPEAQWAVLQAHLERCPDCRAYTERRRGIDRGLAQVLRERWSTLDFQDGAPRSLARSVASARARRDRLLNIAGRVGLGLLALAAVLLFYNQRRGAAVIAPAATAVPEPAVTATDPNIVRDTFRGQLVYSAVVEDNAEIFLLNRRDSGPDGAEITNLTNHPAQDVEPAWSPDGEWIAFLSNREREGWVGDHYELYAISVAGTRLTRLTDAPDIAWQGPIRWSADGQTLALSGRRISTGAGPFVFLVPLSSSSIYEPPRALAYTEGVSGALRFSPTSPQLAYHEQETQGQLAIFHLNERSYYTIPPWQISGWAPSMEITGEFDWTNDGFDLAFLARETSGERISLLVTRRWNLSASLRDEAPDIRQLDIAIGDVRLRGVAVSPVNRLMVAVLVNEKNQGCWKVKFYFINASDYVETRVLDGFCVEGDLRHENWSPDGRWLILTGRPQFAGTSPGIYALRVPGDAHLQEEAFFARISHAAQTGGGAVDRLPSSEIESPPEWRLAQPSVRPSTPGRLEIAVREAPPASPLPLPYAPSESVAGIILYELREPAPDGARSSIYALRLQGLEPQQVARSRLTSACPALAPDGSRFAYLENSQQTSGVPSVMVAGLDGEQFLQVTASARLDRSGGLDMSCPVWSPDGKYLAWIVFRPNENFLKIIDAASGEDWMVRMSTPSYRVPPIWTPDGGAVLYAAPRNDVLSPRILAAPVPGAKISASDERILTYLESIPQPAGNNIYNDLLKMSFSAEGSLAFIETAFLDGYTDLFELDALGQFIRLSDLPSGKFAGYGLGPMLLEYLPDGGLIFSTRHGVDDVYKTVLWVYYHSERQRRPLAYLTDMLYDAALSPDKRWLVYSSDAGLYALDLYAAKRGPAAPYLLHQGQAWDVDWR